MPSDNSGFSGNELVSFLQSYTGNDSTEFRSFCELILPLAEFRFCKAHDWSFLHKVNLSLAVTDATDEYALSTSTIGFYMKATDVKSVYDPTNKIYLKKTNLETIRRMDPGQTSGNASSSPTHWAPIGDNRILIYPATITSTTLKVDGKITPTALSVLTNYPTIPYSYQDSFISYLQGLALDRENDDRANSKKAEAIALLKQDVQDDMGNSGDSADEPRIKHPSEQADGVGGNISDLYRPWAGFDE
jgi:hypothetical protein